MEGRMYDWIDTLMKKRTKTFIPAFGYHSYVLVVCHYFRANLHCTGHKSTVWDSDLVVIVTC